MASIPKLKIDLPSATMATTAPAPRRRGRVARAFSPWYRPRNIFLAFIGIPVLLLTFAVAVVWSQPVGIPGKYTAEIERLVAERQPTEGTEGWPLLISAIDKLDAAEMAVLSRAAGPNSMLPKPADLYAQVHEGQREADDDPAAARAERIAESRRFINDLRAEGAFLPFDQAAAAARFNRPAPTGQVISMLLPDLGRARKAARMCGARIALGFQSGDYAEIENATEHALMLARATAAQFTLIDHLVGIAIFALAENRLREGLIAHPPKGEAGLRFIDNLQAILERGGALPPLSHAIAGERLSILDTIEWTHTDDGAGNGVLVVGLATALSAGGGNPNPSYLAERFGAIGGLAFDSKVTTTAMVNDYFAEFTALAAVPRPERVGLDELDRRIDNLTWRQRLLSFLLPALNRCLRSSDAHHMNGLALRTMLALERHRCRTNAYPESLQQLVPEDLASIEPERISALPLVYRRINPATDPHGRGYTLYSVGADGTDNGGTFPPEKDRMAVIVGGKPMTGFDYEANGPPEK
ncbi:MAG: hypothetical protein ACT4PL_14670 [Phycisphaerales bacterium]